MRKFTTNTSTMGTRIGQEAATGTNHFPLWPARVSMSTARPSSRASPVPSMIHLDLAEIGGALSLTTESSRAAPPPPWGHGGKQIRHQTADEKSQ